MRETNVIALPVTTRRPHWRLRFPRKRGGWLLLLAMSFVLQCVGQISFGQQDSTRPGGNPFGGGGPVNPNAAKGAKAGPGSKNVKAPTVKPLVEMKIDSETLPPGFSPPPEEDPMMSLEVLPVPIAELEKLKKDDAKFSTALRKADTSEAGRKAVRDGIRYRLGQMCLKEHRTPQTPVEGSKTESGKPETTKKVPTLFELRVKLARDIDDAAIADRSLKAAQVKDYRQFVMQELVNQATPLLENNYYVRLQICLLLGDLELVKENTQANAKLEIFTPAYVPLLKVVADAKQPEKVKIAALYGLRRILKDGVPDVITRTKIGETLIAELKNEKTHPWYQMRLASVLGACDVAQANRNLVIQALQSVVADQKRDWSVRAEAAKSLGRVPVPAGSNPTAFIVSIAEFALQLAKAEQASPGTNPEVKTALIKVYFAFKPVDITEPDATKTPGTAGLLVNAVTKGAAQPAYVVIVPIVSDVLNNKRLTAAAIAALEAWIKANAPGAPKPTPEPAAGNSAP